MYNDLHFETRASTISDKESERATREYSLETLVGVMSEIREQFIERDIQETESLLVAYGSIFQLVERLYTMQPFRQMLDVVMEVSQVDQLFEQGVRCLETMMGC